MNHLHDIEGQIRSGSVICQHLFKHDGDYGSEKLLSSFPRYKNMFIEMVENSECIDLGGTASLEEFKIIPDICRSPYTSTWINFEQSQYEDCPKELNGAIYGAFVLEVFDEVKDDYHFIMWFFIKRNDNYGMWVHLGSLDFYPRQAGGAIHQREWLSGDDDELMLGTPAEFNHKTYLFLVQHIMCGFSAINCTNIGLHKNNAPKFINKKRLRKGKLPLYEYYTLEIKQNNIGSSQGVKGGHNSPRFHLRRGHIREYAKGLYTWVNSCAVGDRSNGVIDKDYKLKGANNG